MIFETDYGSILTVLGVVAMIIGSILEWRREGLSKKVYRLERRVAHLEDMLTPRPKRRR